jgi:alkylation response protein AidB-like acyl-CoA dehydrogenase
MDLELTPEQSELAAVARQLLDDQAPLTVARSYLDGAPDPGKLPELVAEAGWYAVGLEEEDPFGIPGLCLLATEVGAHAAPLPLVDTAVTAAIVAGLDGELAGRVTAGEATATVALLEEGADWSLDGSLAAARPAAGGYRLGGEKLDVHHAATVDALLVIAADTDGVPAAFLVDPAATELSPEPAPIDPAAAPRRVDLNDALVAPDDALVGDEAAPAIERGLRLGAVATAAEAVGAASAALDMAIGYSKERVQFGRPIGEFQALQHVMADAHVRRETATATVLYAAAALEEGTEDAEEAVSIAKAYAARAARDVVEAALQVLGGVAFTWEHDVHLLQRRVLDCERRFGDAIDHERILRAHLARRAVGVPA